MKSRRIFLALLASALPLLTGKAAWAKDGFEAVRCGGDVRSALLRKWMSNEPVMRTEKRRAALGLKDLGGEEITDTLNSVTWLICGKEYAVITDSHDIVRDVLAFPPHSRPAPAFSGGTCQANGKELSGEIMGVLDNHAAKDAETAHYSPQDKTMLPVTAAWRVDEKTGKFMPLPAAGLMCARGAIDTADGGP
jgi:hypothetical protein